MISNISQILASVDLVEVIGRRIQLQRSGASWKGKCPFHGATTSKSLHVTPAKGLWYCFSCNEGHDAIDFIRKFEHLEFMEAAELLATEVGVQVEYAEGVRQDIGIRRQDLHSACVAAAIHYSNNLKSNAGALEYAHSRGFSDDMIKSWQIGYASGNSVVDCGADPDAMVAAGILKRPDKESKDQKLYDFLRGRLIIPLHDTAGRVVGFAGRLIPTTDAKADPDRAPAKYLNTADTPIYKKGELLFGYHQAAKIIRIEKRAPLLVEGQLKAIAAQEAGYPAVANCGTGFGERQATLLARLGDRIDLAMDADPAGIKAAIEIAKLLRQMELDVHCMELQPPPGWTSSKVDPDELLAKELPIIYHDCGDLIEWVYRRALVHPQGTPAWAKEICDKILPIINDHPNNMVRHTELKILSALCGIPVQELKSGKIAAKPAKAAETSSQIDDRMSTGRYLCATCLQLPLKEENNWAQMIDWIRLPDEWLHTLRSIAYVRQYSIYHGIPLASAISQASINQTLKPYIAHWAAKELPSQASLNLILEIQKRVVSEAELKRVKEGNHEIA